MNNELVLKHTAPGFLLSPGATERTEDILTKIGLKMNAEYSEISCAAPHYLSAGFTFEDHIVQLHIRNSEITVESENSAAAIQVYLLFIGEGMQITLEDVLRIHGGIQ